MDNYDTVLSDNKIVYIPQVSSDYATTLDRKGTLSVLRELKSIVEQHASYVNQINRLANEMKKHSEEREKLLEKISPEGEATITRYSLVVWIVCTVIVLLIGYKGHDLMSSIITSAIISGIISVIIRIAFIRRIVGDRDLQTHADYNSLQAYKYYIENIMPIKYNIEKEKIEFDLFLKSGCVEWVKDTITESMYSIEGINSIIRIIESRRADNIKEALNKLDDIEHKNRIEEMNLRAAQAAEMAANESAKQSAYLRDVAKNTKQAATAMKIEAAASVGTYLNARKARKEIEKNRRH